MTKYMPKIKTVHGNLRLISLGNGSQETPGKIGIGTARVPVKIDVHGLSLKAEGTIQYG
jgi:hypothetical protein